MNKSIESAEYQNYKDEIDLIELINVLRRRVKIIVISTLLGFFLSLMYILVATNVYRATAVVSLEISLVDVSRILLISIMKNKTLEDKILFLLPTVDTKNSNNIAFSILNSYSFKRDIVYRLKKEFPYVSEKDENIKKVFTVELDRKTGNVVLKSDQENKVLAKRVLEISLQKLKSDIEWISKDLYNDEGVFRLIVIEKPVLYNQPVRPNKPLIVLSSVISFFIFGIFAAFMVEWFSIKRNREKSLEIMGKENV